MRIRKAWLSLDADSLPSTGCFLRNTGCKRSRRSQPRPVRAHDCPDGPACPAHPRPSRLSGPRTQAPRSRPPAACPLWPTCLTRQAPRQRHLEPTSGVSSDPLPLLQLARQVAPAEHLTAVHRVLQPESLMTTYVGDVQPCEQAALRRRAQESVLICVPCGFAVRLRPRQAMSCPRLQHRGCHLFSQATQPARSCPQTRRLPASPPGLPGQLSARSPTRCGTPLAQALSGWCGPLSLAPSCSPEA